MAPKTSRLLRIVPWNGIKPVLAGPDLHFSCDGVDISSWQVSYKIIQDIIITPEGVLRREKVYEIKKT